jgi:hypothetical protein
VSVKILDETRFFKRRVGAVLIDGADGGRREHERHLLIELRDEEGFLLEIDTLPHIAGGVEFRRADAVAVTACDAGLLIRYWTYLTHTSRHASIMR